MSRAPDDQNCTDCALTTTPRRTFVRDISLAALGALLVAGMPPELLAMRPRDTRALWRAGSTDPRYPIPTEDGIEIDRDQEVILVRWTGDLMAFNLSCPHQRAVLRWDEDKHQFRCPKHKSRYEPDGAYISGRATRSMDRFSLTRDGDHVVVHVDQMHKDDEDHPGWAGAVIHLQGA